MIVHLFFHDKFTKPFIDFINSNFNSNKHFFIIQSDELTNYIYHYTFNVIIIKDSVMLFKQQRKYFKLAEKIIIHGLFSPYLVLSLLLNKSYLHKCYWVIWGGDLYNATWSIKKSFKSRIYHQMRTQVIKDMGYFVTCIKGDYNLASIIYKSKAGLIDSFMYLSNVFSDTGVLSNNNESSLIRVLVGNSASLTNNHLEVFEKLSNFSNVKVIVPLSYGDIRYRDIVIEKGRYMFNDRFEPILDFMPIVEYKELLYSVDIAIFNHNRQEGMGNIITLLGMGKKVYIRSDITTWDFFTNLGILIFDSRKKFDTDDFVYSIYNDNNLKIKRFFSETNLIVQLTKLFNDH